MKNHRKKLKRRARRGQAIIESVLIVTILTLLFMFCVQMMQLYSSKMIAEHASFVAARSNSVGFEDDLVLRSTEVGTIGLAGQIETPANYSGYSPVQLGEVEPALIDEFLVSEGYTLYYEFWDNIWVSNNSESLMPTTSVHVRNYPTRIPLSELFMSDTVNFSGSTRMLNHSEYYLE